MTTNEGTTLGVPLWQACPRGNCVCAEGSPNCGKQERQRRLARARKESYMAEAKLCPFCGEAAHVYFCLKDPRYLADPVGFKKTEQARRPKSTLALEGESL